ncbi:MAG: hypothetical protein V1944_02660 [Candidatus Aenigmatarchaeota archaeon]
MTGYSPDSTTVVGKPFYEEQELRCVTHKMKEIIRTEKRIGPTALFDYYRQVSLFSDWPDDYLRNTLAHYAQILKKRGKIRIISDRNDETIYIPRGRIGKRVYGFYYKILDSVHEKIAKM